MDAWERSVQRRMTAASRARARQKHQPGVYFITGAGMIKIGYVSASYSGGVARRLGSVQGCSPVPVELHRFVPFGRPAVLERCLHRRYADAHSHGEWFDATILSELDELSDEQIVDLVYQRFRQPPRGPSMDSCSANT